MQITTDIHAINANQLCDAVHKIMRLGQCTINFLGFRFGALRETKGAGRLVSCRWNSLPRVLCREKTCRQRASWWWSLGQQAANKQLVSSSFPGRARFVVIMGSGGSKNKDKKGSAAGDRDQPQQQGQAAAEKTISQGASKQQTAAAEVTTSSEEKMSEEFVEAVVAKASEFGDNE